MNLIAVYPSTSEAGRQLGLKNASNISQAMKKGWKVTIIIGEKLRKRNMKIFKIKII